LSSCRSKKDIKELPNKILVKDLSSIHEQYNQCYLAGYYKEKDGGQGYLKLVKANSSNVDRGLFFKSNKQGYLWRRTVNDTITTLQYGIDNSASKDETYKVQFMIEAAHKNDISVIKFSPGKYIIAVLDFHPGLEFLGTKDTWLLKKPKSGRIDRMFTSKKNQHNSNENSALLKFTKLNIDGQMKKQGKHDNYELEQQQMIFLAANKKSKGRLQVKIDSCYFKNGVSDAIMVYHNVDATITNSTAENVFRGGIVVAGGSSSVYANNFTAFGDIHTTGIDIEVDGTGYDNNYAVDITMENIFLSGDCDIAVREGSFYGRNIINTGPHYYFAARYGSLTLEDSKFYSANSRKGKIRLPNNIHFKNCEFVHRCDEPNPEPLFLDILWAVKTIKNKNQKLKFEECKFIVEGKSCENLTVVKSIVDDKTRENRLIIDNCTFDSRTKRGVVLKRGGNVEITDSEILSDIPVDLNSSNRGGNFNYSAKLSNLKTKPGVQKKVEYKDHKDNVIVVEDNSILQEQMKSKKGVSKAKISIKKRAN